MASQDPTADCPLCLGYGEYVSDVTKTTVPCPCVDPVLRMPGNNPWWILDRTTDPPTPRKAVSSAEGICHFEGRYYAIARGEPDPYSVARTHIDERTYVSTVFMGVNMGHGHGRPKFFETMVFTEVDGNQRRKSGYEHRWSTWQEAQVGHVNMVKEYITTEVVAEVAEKVKGIE